MQVLNHLYSRFDYRNQCSQKNSQQQLRGFSPNKGFPPMDGFSQNKSFHLKPRQTLNYSSEVFHLTKVFLLQMVSHRTRVFHLEPRQTLNNSSEVFSPNKGFPPMDGFSQNKSFHLEPHQTLNYSLEVFHLTQFSSYRWFLTKQEFPS